MNQFGDMTSAEVASEAESERAGLARTLDQIRENLQPRNMVDEVMSHARFDTAGVSDRVMSVARANPVAAALIGIGAAMLVGAGRMRQRSTVAAERSWDKRLPSGASPDPRFNPTEREYENGRYKGGPARLSQGSDFDQLPTRPLMNTLSAIRHPRSGLSRLLDEQPLVLAALGVAVGAAIGAAIPSTDIEAEWMGDASQTMKRNASAAARQQFADLKATAGQTFEQMKATAAEHGASADNLSGLIHDLGDHVRDASQTLSQTSTSRAQS